MDSYKDNTFDDTQSNFQSIDHSRAYQRIAILGASYVGKTQIFNQLMGKGYQEVTEQGIYEDQMIDVEVNGNISHYQIIDVPGNYDCSSFLKDCKGYLLVFSLDDPLSFKRMQELYKSILKINGRQMKSKIIVVGNKRDLPKHEKQVKTQEIKKFYQENKQEYIKLSSKDKKSIDMMIKKLIENIWNDYPSLSKSNILSNSVTATNPYASQTITQTGVSRNHNNQKTSITMNQNEYYYCDNSCKQCTIF